MSLRCQTGSGLWASLYQGLGATGAVIKALPLGAHGASIGSNDGLLDSAEYYFRVTTPPATGSVRLYELGDFDQVFVGDGQAPWSYSEYENGVLQLPDPTVVQSSVGTISALTATATGISNTVVTVLGTVSITVSGSTSITADVAGQAAVTATLVGSIVAEYIIPALEPSKRLVKVSPKDVVTPTEKLDYQDIEDIVFDYARVLTTTETIVSAVCVVDLRTGSDDNPSLVLGEDPKTAPRFVSQRVVGRFKGTKYNLRCLATTSSGRRLVTSVVLSFGH